MESLKLTSEQIDELWDILKWLEVKGGRERLEIEAKDGQCYSFLGFAFPKTAPGNHWFSLNMTLAGQLKLEVSAIDSLDATQQSVISWARGEFGGLWRAWVHEGRLLTQAEAPGWQPLGAEQPRLRLSALSERLYAPVSILAS